MRCSDLFEAFQFDMFPAAFPSDSLYHTTSPALAFDILKHHQVRPRVDYVSFSRKPHVYDIRERGAVLVFNSGKLHDQLEPVQYTEAWAKAHPDQVRYIAGEGWTEQFEYSPEDDDWSDGYESAYSEAEIASFLHKADEQEWISVYPGLPVVFTPDAVIGLILDAIEPDTQQELRRLGYGHVKLQQR
jgi:hypothetical protein